jgi:hypothetical protein
MQPELTRTAFTFAAVHRRRDALRVTAVALHQRAGRVYLGLDSGVLEEHRITAAAAPGGAEDAASASTGPGLHPGVAAPAPAQAMRLRLQAEKHLFRGAVAALAIALGAARVAAMSDDGQVRS